MLTIRRASAVTTASLSSPAMVRSAWQAAPEQPMPTKNVIPASMPPVTIADTFNPVKSTQSQAGTTVYDFGKITAGWTRITVQGKPGTTVTLTYGQTLNDDGTVYKWHYALNTNVGGPEMHVDTYTLRGGGLEVWEPRFTRHGFQYVEVSVPGDAVDSFKIEARENYTVLPSTGQFSCGNALLNQIHENQRRSLMLNHWGFPTDTAWRDRQGWTADTALYMDGAILNFAGVDTRFRPPG